MSDIHDLFQSAALTRWRVHHHCPETAGRNMSGLSVSREEGVFNSLDRAPPYILHVPHVLNTHGQR